jgi:adenine-specific DNA-methyltransferase
MSTTITDSKFADLKAKLRELFELDKSDLDFGIYRIIAAKNKEVNEFLDRQLKDVVRQTLAAHGAGASDQVQAELDKAIQQAQALGADPDALPKVQELKTKLAAAGGASAAELEADIYNHLLAFFGRYYDEGDFISKRRYKGDVYAIPYGGEEVTLHWANKDQYYIKSGEWHKDYRFKVSGKTVRFKLVEATQETNNNKEPDDAKRRYILDSEKPVEETDGELTLRFQFRHPTEAEKQAAVETTRIFGGKYSAASGRTKGDEREQFCADAEQRALAATPEACKPLVSVLSATETKPGRTILGKHLDHFTARNTFDYFIHKDLGGFLKRELDFYIKNEVVRLDDLETLPPDHLAKVQGKVKALRAVALPVINFLAAVENFQKKMWLKKKLVLETNWLVTIDRIPAILRDVVAANPKQWTEWESLGFKPADGDPTLLSNPKWQTREYLDANDKLVVDTYLFPGDFTAELLASEEIIAGQDSIASATSGLLIHSENFQALSFLQERYRRQIACIYTDPPYNTDAISIIYKNGYKESSWDCLITDRLGAIRALTDDSVPICQAIDDTELDYLCQITRLMLPRHELHKCIVEHYPGSGTGRSNVSRTHEYALFSVPIGSDILRGNVLDSAERVRGFRRSGTGSNNFRTGRPNSFYAVLVDPATRQIRGFERPPALGEKYLTGPTEQGWLRVYPLGERAVGDQENPERVWSLSYESAPKALENGRLQCTEDLVIQRLYTDSERRELLPSIWQGAQFSAVSWGTNVIQSLFRDASAFSYPKSVNTVRRSIDSMIHGQSDAWVLDYFAGSGTTGHAVINLNREDDGDRRFMLIEMGAYFDTVLKPRIVKVLYSPEWKDGKAQVHGKGASALVKYFTLESYEDALNNLPAPTGEFLPSADPATKDALITYSLDLEMGPNLLNLDAFKDPWGYTINAQPAGEAEIKPHRVDLVETFNYLLGIKVKAYGQIERYAADFERAKHADGLGRLKVAGRMRRDKAGPFVFQRVEGELLDGTRVLVVWRKLTGDAERDAAALEAWMNRHREETKERSEHREYHLIYINGPVTLPQPTAEIRTVLPIEQTFKDRMFADGGVA